MAAIKPFDAIVVREKMERIQRSSVLLQQGYDASRALLWFDEYALKYEPASEAIDLKASVVASATANADIAQRYIRKASDAFKGAILAAAIEAAKADLKSAETPHAE